jgi:hypothetical protein
VAKHRQLKQREYSRSILDNTVRAFGFADVVDFMSKRGLTNVDHDQPTSRGFGRSSVEEPSVAVKPAKKSKRVFDDDDDDDDAPKGNLKVRTSSHKNADSLKESAKQQPMVRLTFKEGESRTVRFLHEPFGKRPWVEFAEHFVPSGSGGSYVPCIDGCKLDGDIRASKRWYANVWDRDSKSVRLLKMTGAMIENLVLKYEKRGTLMDRDYSITRTGESTDTKYHIEPEDKEKFNVASDKIKLIDIEEYLNQAAQTYYGGQKVQKAKSRDIDDDDDEDEDEDEVEDTDDEDDEDEKPKKKATAKKKASRDEDEDDDDEDSDDDDDDDSEDDEDEEEDEKPKKKTKVVAKKRRASDDDEDDDDEDTDDDDDDDEDEDEAPRKKSSTKKRPLGRRR